MTDTTQKVEPTDARQASMARVVTHESLMASLVAPASEVTDVEPKVPAADDKPKEGEQKPAKKGPQERITALVQQRKDAEAKAEAADKRAQELEARLQALEAKAEPIAASARPQRSKYASDDEFNEALTDWKAREIVAEREKQQAEARQRAAFDEVVAQWNERQQKVIDAISDYAETIAKSEVKIPDAVHDDMLEREHGPEMAYYFALHPKEAKSTWSMKPRELYRYLDNLEKELADDEPAAAPAPKASALPTKSKAPEPINPVKSTGASNPGKAESFEEYKRRRQASKGR